MKQASSAPAYPRLLRRVRAALIDYVVFIVLFFGWFFSVGSIESVHPALKVSLLVFGILLVDPGLVSRTGGTIGHHLTGLRIQDSISGDSIGILRATGRAILRTVFGAFSFIFILATRKHQAIHDSICRTVVVLKRPDSAPEWERFRERELVPEGFELPGAFRRVIMILVYGLLSLVLFSILIGLAVSAPCIDLNTCTASDDAISLVLSLLWFVSLVPIVVFAWKGLMFGCRRRRVERPVP